MLAVDVETGKAAARRSGAHAAAINRLLPLSENAVASGDDDGAVYLWDTRQACYRPSGVVFFLWLHLLSCCKELPSRNYLLPPGLKLYLSARENYWAQDAGEISKCLHPTCCQAERDHRKRSRARRQTRQRS